MRSSGFLKSSYKTTLKNILALISCREVIIIVLLKTFLDDVKLNIISEHEKNAPPLFDEKISFQLIYMKVSRIYIDVGNISNELDNF